MPMRNPFKRAPGVEDETPRHTADGAFKDTRVEGGKTLELPKIVEYKLCDISDNGVYMPPSPSESKSSGFWHSTSNTSTNSSYDRSVLNDNEPFNISRESFDSFRRSFDISARSPVPNGSGDSLRRSLDSRRMNVPRSSFTRPSIDRPNAHKDQGFEEVRLAEETKPVEKKRGLFGFGHSDDKATTPATEKKSHGLFTGRRRGQSGTGSELKAMEKPTSQRIDDIHTET